MQVVEFDMSAARTVAKWKSVFTDPVTQLATSRLIETDREAAEQKSLVALTLLRRKLEGEGRINSGSQFSTTPLLEKVEVSFQRRHCLYQQLFNLDLRKTEKKEASRVFYSSRGRLRTQICVSPINKKNRSREQKSGINRRCSQLR